VKRCLLVDHHVFETGRPVLVCGNTADMRSQTRYGRYFRIDGDKDRHYGLFSCGPALAAAAAPAAASGGG